MYDFDVLALSELWLLPSVPNRLVSVDGYNLYRVGRPQPVASPNVMVVWRY